MSRTIPSHPTQRIVLPLALALIAGCLLACSNDEPYGLLPADRTAPVKTYAGEMVGEYIPPRPDAPGGPLPGIDVFRGVPYAAPPVGALRWKAPQSAPKTEGVREMVEFGPSCPQPQRPDAEPDPQARFDEDCLTLNIWTTSDRSGERPNPTMAPPQRPVFVWIHGGGFRIGSGSGPMLDGARFVADGAVLVTLNYRLGALGFLAHEQLLKEQPVANFGLLDMRFALGWIKDNIQAFGGDRNNITIFGESAGGMAVQLLMSQQQPSFEQAISMSGYGTWPLPRVPKMIPAGKKAGATNPLGNRKEATVIDAAAMGKAIIDRALEAASMDSGSDLRAIPVDALVGAVESLHMPVVDGTSLPDEPAIVFAKGKQAKIPFIAGGNSYDGAVMAMAGLPPKAFLESWGPWKKDLRKLYATDFEISEALGASRLFGDGRYLLAARRMAASMQTVDQPAYLYYYDWVPEDKRGEWPGTPHAAEIHGLFASPSVPAPDEGSLAAGQTMRSFFLEFARTRKPAPASTWPTYSSEQDQWLVFLREGGTELQIGVLDDKLDFLEARYLERLTQQGIAPQRKSDR